jgi:hypothetical protein
MQAKEFNPMAKTDAQIAPYWEAGVWQFVTDSMQGWQIAAHGAIDDAEVPQEKESIWYWVVSLAGNMLWAATVFFPPAGAVAAAAALT